MQRRIHISAEIRGWLEYHLYIFHSFEAGIADAIASFKWMKNTRAARGCL